MSYRIAVVGATGRIGTEILNILVEREFPVKKIYAIASAASIGKEVAFGDNMVLKVENIEAFDFSQVDIVLASAGAGISKKFMPMAVKSGAIVIDNTSFFRMDPDIPLIIPEVNPQDLAKYTNKGIIANPNCSTIGLVVPLAAMHKKYQIKRIVVATYQSVSGAGSEAMDELFHQTKSIYIQQNPLSHKIFFTKQIAFNLIPHIDIFMKDGSTKEEWKMITETQKILDSKIKLAVTCVRVPVFIGHSLAVNVEFAKPITEHVAREILKTTAGVSVVDFRQNEGYVTPLEVAGEDNIYVSRIREDSSLKNTLNMWVVIDNLRKGGALNAVQIAEELVKIRKQS